MVKISHEVVLVVETCCACGTPFGIEQERREWLLRTGERFYCPNGHPQVFAEPTGEKLKRLEKELKAARENEKWWKNQAEGNAQIIDETKRALKTTRAKLTRTEKRIKNGVCPCCNRQFVNLQRHMAGQHPDYKPEE